MEDILFKKNNNDLLFEFKGRIDSTFADTKGNEVYEKLFPEANVTFDFQNVNYVSSAGLRMVLKSAKSCKNFVVINVINEVYDVFEMTGFTSILKVKRALREVSVEGLELIGQGFCGRVFRIDPDTIIKAFRPDIPLTDVEVETSLAKRAFILGIPTAIPFDVVKVKEGGYGSVFELLKSDCMNKLMIRNPEKLDYYISLYVKVLKTIVNTVVDEDVLPHKKEFAFEWVDDLEKRKAFAPNIIDKLRKLVDSIPDTMNLVHGDFHIKNLMMQGEEPILIDMETLSVGHPIFELSAMYLAYFVYNALDPNNTLEFFGVDNDVVHKIFYKSIDALYADRSEEERQEIIGKISLLTNMWMVYRTYIEDPNNKARMEYSVNEVLNNIDKYTTLDF